MNYLMKNAILLRQRLSSIKRGPVDTIMALALIHHLSISHNLSLEKIAAFFSEMCDSLVIEFIPKTDSQVQRLLVNRKDMFEDYTQEVFENKFRNYFNIEKQKKIHNSERTIYLMRTKPPNKV